MPLQCSRQLVSGGRGMEDELNCVALNSAVLFGRRAEQVPVCYAQ